MTTNWKDKTCRDCTYRVEGDCRRFPPTIDANTIMEYYPNVERTYKDAPPEYKCACAEYNESE